MIEIIRQSPTQNGQLKVAIFDFDGTISTLRHVKQVMGPMMIEMIVENTNHGSRPEVWRADQPPDSNDHQMQGW